MLIGRVLSFKEGHSCKHSQRRSTACTRKLESSLLNTLVASFHVLARSGTVHLLHRKHV